MTRLMKAVRDRREASRNRRVMEYAIENAGTSSHRDELLAIFQYANGYGDVDSPSMR